MSSVNKVVSAKTTVKSRVLAYCAPSSYAKCNLLVALILCNMYITAVHGAGIWQTWSPVATFRSLPGKAKDIYGVSRISLAINRGRFGRVIELFVAQRFCSPHVYLVPHKGQGIPSGVQAIIRDISVFEIEPLN